MIAIHDLQFQYRGSDFRLCVPELAMDKGSRTALIGPSGSGKTTLLSLIAGIMLPSSGRVVTNGVEVSALGDRERRLVRVQSIGMVFQEFELLEHLNVLDNILLPCRITGSLRLTSTIRSRAIRLAEGLDMADKLHRFVRRLSQGERQRVAICRALLFEPALLLCDEPTGNLDPSNKMHVLEILDEYVQQNDATMVTVTHDHEILERFDDVVDCKQYHDLRESVA